MVGVSESKVRKVCDNLWDFGTKRAPQLVVRGPAPLITAAMAQALRELLVVRPSLYIDELVWFCYDEFDLMVSEITLRRWLCQQILKEEAPKKGCKAEPNGTRRVDGAYLQTQRQPTMQLVFLDESAANERTSDRKYGWAPPGVRAAEYLPIKRSER